MNVAAATGILQKAASAISGVVDQIKRLPDVVRPWVDAFNPAAGQRLDYAFRSLSATIGYAFEPVILSATKVVDGFAGAIMGGMERLRGPVERAASLFANAIQPALQAVSIVFDGLATAAQILTPIMDVVAEALAGLGGVAAVLAQGLSMMVEGVLTGLMNSLGGMQSAVDFVRDQFTGLAITTMHVVTALMDMFGQAKMAKDFLKAVASMKPPPSSGRQGAPEGFGIGGLEDLYRRRLVSAAQGAGKDNQQLMVDYLKDIRESARQLVDVLEKDPEAFSRMQKQVLREKMGETSGTGIDWGVRIANWFRQDQRNQP